MCNFIVGTVVTWTVDNQKYRITAVHPGLGQGCTYDIALVSNDATTQSNVIEGNLRVDL